ncbi:MAG: CGNR zinc finger domain-containing protein [Thermoleophilaceae bacterium]
MIQESHPEQKRAPEPLELVRNFVNTADVEDAEEDVGSGDSLRAWLVGRGLMDPTEPVSDGDVRRAHEVREGLRAMLLANNGVELDRAAVEALDRAASRAGLRPRFEPGAEPTLEPDARGVDGALAHLLAIVAQAAADGSWYRLKACPSESCRWAFYDRSKNRSKRWCRMDVCGNAAKARAYRRRHAKHA